MDLLCVVLLYTDIGTLISVYKTCSVVRGYLRNSDTVDLLFHIHDVKKHPLFNSFWDFVFLHNCNNSTCDSYRDTEDAEILKASRGEPFRFPTTPVALAAIECRNPHWKNPGRELIYSSYHDDKPSYKKIGFINYARVIDQAVSLSEGALFVGGVYRNNISRIHEALLRGMIPESVKETAEYGRCNIHAIMYLLTTHKSEFRNHISTMLWNAVKWRNRELVVYLMSSYPMETDIHDALISAVMTLDLEMVDFVLTLTNDEIDWKIISSSVEIQAQSHIVSVLRR